MVLQLNAILRFIIIIHFIYHKCLLFPNQIMLSLIPSEANDPQGLMRR